MRKIKVMTVFGTRPEAIKMAPIVKKLKEQQNIFDSVTTVTGQHKEMLQQVLNIFNIKADYNLDIMKSKQTLVDITNNVISRLDKVLKDEKPDIVLVHGDTTTTFAAAVDAFYNRIPVGHVEAGLRTWNKYSPFPEEMNRQMCDVLSDLYFAPTIQSRNNLLKENHNKNNIFITGNTAIDALKDTISETYHHEVLDNLVDPNNKIVLVTMHRRENLGKPMENVFNAIRNIVIKNKNVEIIYPVHLNPKVRAIAKSILGDLDRIHLVKPLDVIDFHNLMKKSYFVMTDSGGVQEEAPSLGKPVLVLRDTTERPEGVSAGTLKLVGTETKKVEEMMESLLNDKTMYKEMSEASNPYGDGNAADRILEAIEFSIRNKTLESGE
ncbi:non-hydrolyzing UDP-N-acetylglucosamine 2-epimerase [Limosilactobacillus reuteri]|uniref:non-hydrolyzing UDP-N-acetylglucosamine 2-epimerase n=1 Tax=Limosilactobacillus reuteri TaxID=1598 RepID=UPI001C1162DB|nr:UDP-N-acetylglucosamine 2-epimerase (non-hydrolyzing) [Limosilactobacillus reuteri]MBU5284243.1 UDP-N-acetylglucosamine 2-epimerase (non-hydrolyzing) [Limosilactobacillus reuteri]